jgi:hypothetical protein
MFCKVQAKHKKAKLPALSNRCASHFLRISLRSVKSARLLAAGIFI